MDWVYAVLGLVIIVAVAGFSMSERAKKEQQAKKEQERIASLKSAARDRSRKALAEGMEAKRQGTGESACPYRNLGNDPGHSPVYPDITVPSHFDDPRFWWLVGYRGL